MVNNEIFYMIWNSARSNMPSYKHGTYQAAEKEATRLASLNPGKEFIVLQAVCSIKKQNVEKVIFTKSIDDEIPF